MSSIPLTTEALAPLSLHSPAHLRVQLSQTAHRLNIVRAWTGASTSSPTPDPSAQDDGQASAPWTYDFAGKKVLEIGCGQGDMTAVLAAHVSRKEGGNVTAMDPAPLDYGSPFNLGQAQSHLSSGPLGPHISWVQSDPLSFLSASSSSSPPTPSTPLYSSAILAHSIYYLSAPTVLHSQLLALKRAGITHLFLAEYALCSRSSALGFPHVLAVLSQAVHPDSVGNVRSVLSPSAIKAMARQAGWRLCAETILTNPEVDDGKWEVGAALEMEREDEAGVAQAHRDALRASLPPGGVKEVKTMDVWTAVFEADDTP